MTTSSVTLPVNGGIHRSSSSSNREAFPTLQPSWESNRDSLALEDADGDSRATARHPSPQQGNGSALNDRWQPRRSGHVAWDDGPGHVTGPRPPRRSISEAWRNVRRRQGSVSANAHDIAEALKAPVSVKLVVCPMSWKSSVGPWLMIAGAVRSLVRQFCVDQYALEIDSQRISRACHFDTHPICIRVRLVCVPGRRRLDVPAPSSKGASAQEWPPISES